VTGIYIIWYGETERNHEKYQTSRSLDEDSNRGCPAYEAGCSVQYTRSSSVKNDVILL
jgi:hypothetical protein